MSLSDRLATFSAQFGEKCSQEKTAAVERAIAELAAGLSARTQPEVGTRAPDFTVVSTGGDDISLQTCLRQGPVILLFYRGGWCPYCALTLRAYQQAYTAIRAAGGDLIALSPQTRARARSDVDAHQLSFVLASDPGAEVARRYGIDYELAGELKKLYQQLGHPLPDYNGDDTWLLPVPATFVIARNGIISLRHVEADHRKRLEPAVAIASLQNG